MAKCRVRWSNVRQFLGTSVPGAIVTVRIARVTKLPVVITVRFRSSRVNVINVLV